MNVARSELSTLLYVSTMSPRTLISDVAVIARTSRRRNQEDRITGVLVFDGSSFAQLVEGPPEPIAALRARLEQDTRHFDMDVLHHGRAGDERRFAQWTLGYHFAEDDHDELAALRGLRDAQALARFDALRERIDSFAGVATPAP